jgi:hypothetical protein
MSIGLANPRPAAAEAYWCSLDETDHSVQVYDNASVFLDVLEGFASSGLRASEGVIVIATASHRRALGRRLVVRGFDLERARAEQRYVDCDAETTLCRFMHGGQPDEAGLLKVAGELMARASGADRRRVRVFGEMAALLWAEGNTEAAFALERLWDDICAEQGLRLFCAYPHSRLAAEGSSLSEICRQHSRVIRD